MKITEEKLKETLIECIRFYDATLQEEEDEVRAAQLYGNMTALEMILLIAFGGREALELRFSLWDRKMEGKGNE